MEQEKVPISSGFTACSVPSGKGLWKEPLEMLTEGHLAGEALSLSCP